MKHVITCFSFVSMMFIAALSAQAQQAVLAASDDAIGATGAVSYSVGQIAYNLNISTDGFIIEGVQQPFEYQFHIGIDEINGEPLKCSLYPNPAGRYTILKIEGKDLKNLSCQLYNMNGFLLQNMKIENPETYVNVDDLSPASYSLTVSHNDRIFQSFILIKK
jgi:hypothetical protein